MLSTSIFSSNGSVYRQSAVFGNNFVLNETALEEVGLPALTGSNAWTNLTANLAVRAPNSDLPLHLGKRSSYLTTVDWGSHCACVSVLGFVRCGSVQARASKDATGPALPGDAEV